MLPFFFAFHANVPHETIGGLKMPFPTTSDAIAPKNLQRKTPRGLDPPPRKDGPQKGAKGNATTPNGGIFGNWQNGPNRRGVPKY